jgi:Domain of unknown function (DUF6259)
MDQPHSTCPLALAMVVTLGLVHCALAEVTVGGDRATFSTPRLEATFRGGTLVALTNRATGEAYLEGGAVLSGLRFGDQHVEAPEAGKALATGGEDASALVVEDGFGGGNRVETRIGLDAATSDLLITQSATSTAKGLAQVLWGAAGVRDDLDVIVPGQSGRKLKGGRGGGQLQWPIGWEAALVIVQGERGGFAIWAEDPELSHFKALDTRRRDKGCDLQLASENPAPFDALDSITSCTWRLSVYEGDWRVPARRYRDWMEKVWGLKWLGEQQPAWVRDIRFVVICGMDAALLDALAEKVDPKATLLYVPSWRRDGYDRNYPDYTALPELGPFVERAHELGFRVMPHVNYFGCDPKNELYTQFEPYQLTDPYSKAKLWWTWDRADPPIKFAYIDPAHKPWRELFIARMVEAWKTFGFDALHLDQTLCIWNDSRGLMDGLNCAQGNRLLHKELRAALPEVALSGEGLDEVTTAYEAFAQHHALGLNFVEGTWDESAIRSAHPIRSYLLGPFTQSYGYLGMTNPSNAPLYGAWREAYRVYGVLPTLAHPWLQQVKQPTGFVRQVLDEGAFFAKARLAPDFDGPWPADVLFPYRSADGGRVTYAADFGSGTKLVARDGGPERAISRTVHGVETVELPGTIPGWRVYDDKRLMGLDPASWYAYFDDPRDPDTFHVTRLPEGFRAEAVNAREALATVTLARRALPGGDLLARLDDAETGIRRPDGSETRQKGPLNLGGEIMASFVSGGTLFHVHPPWRSGPKGAEGMGTTFAEFRLRVPKGADPVFDSEVFVDQGAVGKTDGVRFRVVARGAGETAEALVTTAVAEPRPLRLDLSRFAGQEIVLRLEVDTGEAGRADFDWARWARPTVRLEGTETAELGLVCPWLPAEAVSGLGEGELAAEAAKPRAFRATGVFPGSLILLRQPAPAVALPLDLTKMPFVFSAQTYGGSDATEAQFVSAGAGPASCGGQSRPALNMHPPNGGISRADFPMRLPEGRALLVGFTGIRDGSKSEGVRFVVEANGQPLFGRLMLPSSWEPLEVDLSAWAGRAMVLTLAVDSAGTFSYDWAAWGEVKVTGDR